MPNKIKVWVDSMGVNRVVKCACDMPNVDRPFDVDRDNHTQYIVKFPSTGTYNDVCPKCDYFPWYFVTRYIVPWYSVKG